MPPTSWERDIGLLGLLAVVLVVPSVLLLGGWGLLVVAAVLLTVANVRSAVRARHRHAEPADDGAATPTG